MVQQEADPEPQVIELMQEARVNKCGRKKDNCQRQRRQARSASRCHRPKCDERENRGKDETKRAIGRRLDLASIEAFVGIFHLRLVAICVGIWRGAVSGLPRVPSQAARSMASESQGRISAWQPI